MNWYHLILIFNFIFKKITFMLFAIFYGVLFVYIMFKQINLFIFVYNLKTLFNFILLLSIFSN